MVPNEFFWHCALAEAYWLKGMWPDFAQQIEKEIARTKSPEKAAEIPQAHERGGYKALSQERLEFLEARSRKMYTSPIKFAYQYAFLNDKEQTMANVLVEPRPKSRTEGSPIEDVVEEQGDKVLGIFKTQKEAIDWARKERHTPLVARVRHENDEDKPDHWRSV